MQGHGRALDPSRRQLRQQGRGEMKPCGGGRDRPLGPGIDSLVILRILRLDGPELADIGRQRHGPFAMQSGHQLGAAAVEAQQDVPGRRFIQDLGRQILAEQDAVAGG
jgi:hypothetical protein